MGGDRGLVVFVDRRSIIKMKEFLEKRVFLFILDF